MTIRMVIAPANKSADSCWRRVKNRDLIFFDDFPESILSRMVRSTFIHHTRSPISQNSVYDVAMPRHPADISRTPVDIIFFKIKDHS